MSNREVMQQALEALEELDGLDTETECVTIDVGDVMDALRTALEQQAEPVHGDIRALKYRIHELEGEVMGYKRMLDVAEAASQPQQQAEPVAWMDREGDLYKIPEIPEWAPPHTMLYTAPPQRQWVGLTDEEIQAIHDTYYRRMGRMEFAQKLEAKLKEKNT